MSAYSIPAKTFFRKISRCSAPDSSRSMAKSTFTMVTTCVGRIVVGVLHVELRQLGVDAVQLRHTVLSSILDIFNDDCRGKLQDQELSGVGQHAVHDLASGLAATRIGKILTLVDWNVEL